MQMNRGFSLVELSIVLVILGLLTGGILAGQSLIRAAELRSVTTEYQRWMTATSTFRDKYMAIPGDMREATRFWNRQVVASHCVSNHGLSTAGSPGTCDGNGDGALSNPGAASQSGEVFQFWNQLAYAGLIEGTYSGLAGAGSIYSPVIGTNVPSSKLGNAGWDLRNIGTFGGDASSYAATYDNTLEFGGFVSNASPLQAPILKPEEAWNIDTKLDDGKPGYGKIIARYHSNACAVADDGNSNNGADLNGSYKVSDTSLQCSLYFVRAF